MRWARDRHPQPRRARCEGDLEDSLPHAVQPLEYDAMFSYRWNDYDSTFVERLFDCVSSSEVGGKPVVVFLDRKRLCDGDALDMTFMNAMKNSRVVVPIVSWEALKRMTTLTEDSVCDNVLLSGACHRAAAITREVMPLFVGTINDDGKMSNLFLDRPPRTDDGVPVPDDLTSSRVCPTLSSSRSSGVEKFARETGLRLSAEAQTRTARQVVNELRQGFNGVPVWDLPHARRWWWARLAVEAVGCA